MSDLDRQESCCEFSLAVSLFGTVVSSLSPVLVLVVAGWRRDVVVEDREDDSTAAAEFSMDGPFEFVVEDEDILCTVLRGCRGLSRQSIVSDP